MATLDNRKTRTMKYQAQFWDGLAWTNVGSPHSLKMLCQENIDGPGGYRDQATARGQVTEFRIVEVTA